MGVRVYVLRSRNVSYIVMCTCACMCLCPDIMYMYVCQYVIFSLLNTCNVLVKNSILTYFPFLATRCLRRFKL
jgi:hypothetical protein